MREQVWPLFDLAEELGEDPDCSELAGRLEGLADALLQLARHYDNGKPVSDAHELGRAVLERLAPAKTPPPGKQGEG